jgi:hypothetical protein
VLNLLGKINFFSKNFLKRKFLNVYASFIKKEQFNVDKNSGERKKSNHPEREYNKGMSIIFIISKEKILSKTSRKNSSEISDVISER